MDHTELNLRNIPLLERPQGKIRVVLDTDAFNEIDDQYALSYALSIPDRLEVEAIYAAPFFNRFSTSPGDGMEKSYQEILRLLPLLHREDLADRIYRGSTDYLKDEKTPQDSPAARDLVRRAMEVPEGERLYVVAIGAITNVASAILQNPRMTENTVVVWLGGKGIHIASSREGREEHHHRCAHTGSQIGGAVGQISKILAVSKVKILVKALFHLLSVLIGFL
jgi:hypothetical protein